MCFTFVNVRELESVGDHLAAFPVNRDEDVEFLIQHLTGIPEDPKRAMIQLQEYKDGTGSNFYGTEI